MADLSSAFEGLGVVQNTSPPQQYHTLNITYPALDLLPGNATPELYQPKHLFLRQRPKLERYHLTPSNLAFFHRIPVNRFLGLAYAPLFNSSLHAGEFLDLISSLVKAPGNNNLEVVSFDSGDLMGICHTFRATVTWASPGGTPHPTVHMCRITAFAFETLLRTSPNPWLALVSNLINRASDRACLHVANQLQASNKPAHRGEGARWARDWEAMTPRSGSFLLASRLQCQLGNGEWIPLHELDRENVAFYSNEQIPFRLPCGHGARLALRALSLTEDSKCAEVACPSCGEKVLGDQDLAELALRVEHQERAAFCYADAEYSDAKIALPAVGRGQELEIPPGAIHRVLQDALESFRVPASASPAALSLVDIQETKAVLRTLQLKAAAAGGQSVRLTPYALWEALTESSMGTLTGLFESGSGQLPPGFMDFMDKWLTRAVNLLIADQGLIASAEETSEELSSLMNTCKMR
ncbi:hypothetical protein Q7P36_010994 [Cladosporium allicinum]